MVFTFPFGTQFFVTETARYRVGVGRVLFRLWGYNSHVLSAIFYRSKKNGGRGHLNVH